MLKYLHFNSDSASIKKYLVAISVISIVTGLLLSSPASPFPVLLTPKTSTTDVATSTNTTITGTTAMSTSTQIIPSASAQAGGGKGQIIEGGPPRPPGTSPVNLEVCKRIEGGGPLRSATDFDIGVFFRSTPTSRLSPPTPIQVNPSTSCGSIQIPQDTYYLVGERPRRDIQGHYTPVRSDGCEGTITRAAPGSTIRCDLVNRYVPPPISLPEIPKGQSRLVTTKIVFNDDGGTKSPSDFPLSLGGGRRPTIDFRTQGPLTSTPRWTSQAVAQIIAPGPYHIGEGSIDPRYTGLSGEGCIGDILPGETKYCTTYNDDKPTKIATPPEGRSKLAISKQFINNDGGNARLNDVTIKVYRTPESIPCSVRNIAGCSQTDRPLFSFQGGAQFIIWPDFYLVAEVPRLPGYYGWKSGDCMGIISPGETKFCTIFNDDIPGRFTSRIPTTPVIP